ncbi:MAG TPA: chain length determinant protein EpsF [Burkholderiaceae bacterium]|nr:chain length determinant protein EpsF [Burkholderiaceae bacterium]
MSSPNNLPVEHSGLTLAQLAHIVWWRRWTVLVVFILIVGGTAAVSLTMAPSYKATATVLLDAKRGDPVLGPMAPSLIPPGFIATQVDIINSPRVAMRAVGALGLDKSLFARDVWLRDGKGAGTLEQFFSERLLRSLEVRPSRESNVISIQFTGAEPNFAAAVANAFARAYVDTSVELLADPARSSAHWFDERVGQLREQLETAQARLSDYQRAHQVLATDERIDVETTRLTELNAQLTAIQGQRAESASRGRGAQDQMASSPDVLQNPVIQNLRSDIARAEGKLKELGAQLGPNHPQFQRSKAELDELSSKLDSEMHQVANSVSANNTVNEQREAEIRTSLEAQKRHVLELRTQRDEVAVLLRDVENAQKALDVAAQRLSQTSLESQAQQTNIQVLSEALPPTQKSSPHTLINVMIASLFGGILSVGAAVARELSDRRLRNADDAVRVFGLPVLARLPAPGRRFDFLRSPWQRLRPRMS